MVPIRVAGVLEHCERTTSYFGLCGYVTSCMERPSAVCLIMSQWRLEIREEKVQVSDASNEVSVLLDSQVQHNINSTSHSRHGKYSCRCSNPK